MKQITQLKIFYRNFIALLPQLHSMYCPYCTPCKLVTLLLRIKFILLYTLKNIQIHTKIKLFQRTGIFWAWWLSDMQIQESINTRERKATAAWSHLSDTVMWCITQDLWNICFQFYILIELIYSCIFRGKNDKILDIAGLKTFKIMQVTRSKYYVYLNTCYKY